MKWRHKLRFFRGDTITAKRPGELIQDAVNELQKETITSLTSSAPGLAFERRGKNEWALVTASTGGNGRALIRVAQPVGNDGAMGDAEIKYQGGQYVLYITFPRVNRSTSVETQPES